jgi:virginiamycin B lyase
MVGPDGNVWFTSVGVGRITPTGKIAEFGAEGVGDIVSGPDGNVWFTEPVWPAAIERVTPSGQITMFSAGLPRDSTPDAIVVGPDANLWFIDGKDGYGLAVGRIPLRGNITEYPVHTGTGPATGATDIVAGRNGDLWYSVASPGMIGRITTVGRVRDFSAGLPADAFPGDLVVGPDGNIWFTEAVPGGNAIARITPAGRITEFPVSQGGNLTNIVAGPDGNLWFPTNDPTTIARITPSGKITQFSAGIPPPSREQGAPNIGEIVVGPDKNLWFTQSNPPAIGRITPDGHITELGSSAGPWT